MRVTVSSLGSVAAGSSGSSGWGAEDAFDTVRPLKASHLVLIPAPTSASVSMPLAVGGVGDDQAWSIELSPAHLDLVASPGGEARLAAAVMVAFAAPPPPLL